MRHAGLTAGLLVAALLAVGARPARADEPAAWGVAPPPAEAWYGGDVLAADGLGLLLIMGCAKVVSGHGGDWSAACVAPYLLAGPIAHTTHDQMGRAAISLGVRIVLPVVGYAIGGLYPCKDCFIPNEVPGALIGAAAAMVVDLFMAYEPAVPPPRTAPRRASDITPSVALAGGNLSVGVSGWF
jgi:hypothetical protein